MNETSSDFLVFLGRFHPLLVHLPIGFLVVLATLELLALRPRFQEANASARFILVLLVPAAAASAFCGWLLGESGGYEVSLVEWHERTGIGVAIACALLLLLHRLNQKRGYRYCLALTCGLLAVASHLGGSLTHGRDYLTRYAPEPLRSWLGSEGPAGRAGRSPGAGDWTKPLAFRDVVQPILQEYCVSCHGSDKAKAGVRVDSFENLQRGGDHGSLIKPGDSATSILAHVVTLPLDDDGHMPPSGKPQPGADDLALIRWWIDAGASPDKMVGDLKPPAEIERLLQMRFR